jgi:hypothetical protein
MTKKATQLPAQLYKYRPLATEQQVHFVKNIILDNKFFFAPPHFFFDPFEFRFSVSSTDSVSDKVQWLAHRLCAEQEGRLLEDAAAEATQIVSKGAHGRLDGLQTAAEYLPPSLNKKVGIVSFSETWDNVLMWSFYANWHQGVCLGFIASNACPFFGRARKVIYAPKYPTLRSLKRYGHIDSVSARYFKSEVWAHEKEWRIVESGAGGEYRHYPSASLNRIILGNRVPNATEDTIRRWVSSRHKSIKVIRARLCRESYRIVADAIQ